MKLKSIIEEISASPSQSILGDEKPAPLTKDEMKNTLAVVAEYNRLSKSLRRTEGILEVAKKLNATVSSAKRLALEKINEDDWFDKDIVERNMKEASRHVVEFQKLAEESHRCQRKMEAIYEEVGNILQRYYKIDDLPSEEKSGAEIVS